jgi:hypothetical protein
MKLRLLFAFVLAAGALTGVLAASGSGARLATPVVTGFTPTSGTVGSTVQINGSGFTGATMVKIGGTLSSFVVDNDSTIHATVPNVPDTAAATRAKITVYISKAVFGSSDDEFIVILTPKIKGFTPAGGPVGSTVEIRGTDLNQITGATLNGQPIPVIDSGPGPTGTLAHVSIPPGASTGTFTLTNAAGTSAPSAKAFKVTPSVTGFSPSSGPKGSVVTITGSAFTGATKVSFGGKAAQTFTVDSSTQIHATVPPKAVSGPIEVTTPAGKGASAGSFTVTP